MNEKEDAFHIRLNGFRSKFTHTCGQCDMMMCSTWNLNFELIKYHQQTNEHKSIARRAFLTHSQLGDVVEAEAEVECKKKHTPKIHHIEGR
jgi:hypothetical protein